MPPYSGEQHASYCTDGLENLLQIANRNYKDDPREYLLLVIDKERVGAPIRYEDQQGIYPHIYGPVPREAIRAALPVPRAPDGRLLPPQELASDFWW